MMNIIKFYGYDEVFKILAKRFFENFSKVTTDYEIIKLPKKTDVLIVEADTPIREHVKIFDYFKRFNIVEFKSINDSFSLADDLPMILIYIGGILHNEKAATTTNTTFTLVCSRKPKRFFAAYKNTVQKLKNGVYWIKGITEVPVYIVVTNEATGELDQELALLKEFATGNERAKYMAAILKSVQAGDKKMEEYLYLAFSLYKNELKKIAKQEHINMTLVEKNIREWTEELGLKDEYIQTGIKEGEIHIIQKMKTAGYPLDEISKVTGYSKEEIRKLLKKPGKK